MVQQQLAELVALITDFEELDDVARPAFRVYGPPRRWCRFTKLDDQRTAIDMFIDGRSTYEEVNVPWTTFRQTIQDALAFPPADASEL